MKTKLPAAIVCSIALAFLMLTSGCGWLADPGRITVAHMKDKTIRREDIDRYLRALPTEERPHIASRGDLLRVLNQMIDIETKERLAKVYEGRPEIAVPREQAAMVFDSRYPELGQMLQASRNMQMSDAEREFIQVERESRIDRVQKELMGESAVMLRVQEDSAAGTISVSEEEYQREFEYQKDHLKNPETLYFKGVFFPVSQSDASALATKAAERLVAGENVDNVASEYAAAGTGVPLESALANDPRQAHKFATFWQQATGAKKDAVIGPIFIRDWQVAQANASSQSVMNVIPDAFLVCQINRVVPETPMTLDEAKPHLEPLILRTQMIKKLREENEVEVYEDKLPDPAAYDPKSPKSIFDAPKEKTFAP